MNSTVIRQTAWERFRADLQADVLAGIGEHVSRLSWPPDRIASAQREGLRALLAHATAHSAYHRDRLAGLRPDEIGIEDLAGLPVMTKADMMASFDEAVTDPRLTLASAEAALAATGGEPVPILGRYVAHATGGSSGARGVFVYDRAGKAGFILSIMRNLMARLGAAGAPPGQLTFAMVAAASAVHPTRAAAAESAGEDTPVRIVPVPVTLPWQQVLDRLSTVGAEILGGYPSALTRLAAEQRAGRLNLAPAMIVSTSETLVPSARAAITAAFGAPVVDTFACTEGLVGASEPGGSVLTFNTDMCIAELVDAENRPVRPGEPSAKVLVTNLYNLAQPLIRYELTDQFLQEPAEHEAGRPGQAGPGLLRAAVRGRADDMLRYPGVDVHPHVIRSVLVRTPEVGDYQVRQTRRGIDVDILAAPPATAATAGAGRVKTGLVARRLTDALAAAGLRDPDVRVVVVAELARNPESGKIGRFVPATAC
jgi:phenylacetate-CoA ligase